MSKVILFLSLCFFGGITVADAYKWVDENGKIQFGDSPPKDVSAENIASEVNKTNIDSSNNQSEFSVVSGQEKNDDEKAMEQKKHDRLEEAIGKNCRKMKADIASIARGDRGTFIGKDGKEEMVLERDRGKKLEEWKSKYRKSDCQKLYPLE